MSLAPRLALFSPAVILVACLALALTHGSETTGGHVQAPPTPSAKTPGSAGTSVKDPARANELISHRSGFFVPNLGQWDHAGKFVHRSGAMTLFLEDRGWVLDLTEQSLARRDYQGVRGAKPAAYPREDLLGQRVRGAAVRMTFEGEATTPEIVGERKLAGHHNYLLGSDRSRWRTGVPLYGSVRYEGLYPGIDLRMREANGVPEYDLLLQPGADLSRVTVHVEGAKGLSISESGSLVINTVLGQVVQARPKTWQVDRDGRTRQVACNFTLPGKDRFGFVAPGWNGNTSLTIDPGLIWSTYVGGNACDHTIGLALSVDARGVVTVAGETRSTNYPTTTGAHKRILNTGEVFVSRLDPRKTGPAQLVYSTFLGGSSLEWATALSVDANGVVTLVGVAYSADFPTTTGAYDRSFNGGNGGADAFVSRLDPSKTGAAQLLYSTFLGGSEHDAAQALSVDAAGVVTVTGITTAKRASNSNFPTTSGAYSTTPSNKGGTDGFVSRLVLAPIGKAGLLYSTLLRGTNNDHPMDILVDASGVVTVTGWTHSSNFPTTSGAYDRTHNSTNNRSDAFVSRLDPRKIGNAQLVYSTFLGGGGYDQANALSIDANGVVTIAGSTSSTNLPTTSRAYNTIHGGGRDGFVSRLTLAPVGRRGLLYSTFLGGSGEDSARALSVDTSGVVTVAGSTSSSNFPATSGAYDTTYNGIRDAFVSRLDLSKSGNAQLLYSTFLGGSSRDLAFALAVDASGVATVAGYTNSTNFPTTSGAYDTSFNGGLDDLLVSRLDMGVALYGDVHEISIGAGGTQKLTLNAGSTHANRLYWVLGSLTGTSPGVTLSSGVGPVMIPLNPDFWTDITIALANTPLLTSTRGSLDASGQGSASFNVPKITNQSAIGVTFHHAYLVYDANNNFYMTSNPVPLTLVK